MEQIVYTRTVVPSSMRSPYWKYFGFPSDNGNNILTRQKIVCTICNTAIAYNKNTSNLRTHLMAKHVEIFQQIVAPSSSDATILNKNTPCAKNTKGGVNCTEGKDFSTDCNDNQTIRKQRIRAREREEESTSFQNGNEFGRSCSIVPEYENFQSETAENPLVHTNKLDLERRDVDYNPYMTSNYSQIIAEFGEGHADYTTDTNTYKYSDVDLHDNHALQSKSVDIMLADLIQTDLLPLETLEANGFCRYSEQLTGLEINADTIIRVERIIEIRFANMKEIVNGHLQRLSESQPYSLSFEFYRDNIGLEVFNVYINYLNNKKMELKSILYATTIIGNDSVNLSEILSEIYLKNCSGVVVTCSDHTHDFVLDFTKLYGLPLIDCLESMLSRCFQKILDKTEFSADYEKFLKKISENPDKNHLKKSNFGLRCNWSMLNSVEYIFQNADKNILLQCDEFRRSFEYLKPLKMALDIISDEPLPLCSLSRPLIKKLFDDHFNSTNHEESRIYKIQMILQKELHERIMIPSFLKEVTYFDTRFHRHFALQAPHFDVTNLKTRVLKRFEHIVELNYITESNKIKMEGSKAESSMGSRKCSSLKSLFKQDISLANPDDTADLTTNFDLEFDNYHAQLCLDLDQSPVLWWKQQTEKYKQLSKIAKHYLSIPCCCLPRLCRIELEERYKKLDRRNNLSQFCNTESKLWYLYYNEDVANL